MKGKAKHFLTSEKLLERLSVLETSTGRELRTYVLNALFSFGNQGALLNQLTNIALKHHLFFLDRLFLKLRLVDAFLSLS